MMGNEVITVAEIVRWTVSMVDLSLMFWLVSPFLKHRGGSKVKTVVLLLAAGSINTLTNRYFGSASTPGLLLIMLVSGLFFAQIFASRLRRIWGCMIVALIAISIVELLVIVVLLAVTSVPPETFNEWGFYRMLGIVGSKSLSLVLVLGLYPKLNLFHPADIEREGLAPTVVLVGIFNVAVIFISFSIYMHSEAVSGIDRLALVAFLLVVMFFSVTVLIFLNKRTILHQQQREWQIKEEAYRQQVFFTESMQEALVSVRTQRHDFNHHLNCLYGLLEMNRPQEARQYVQKLIKEVETVNDLIGIEHPEMAALLNVKRMTAREKQIPMELEASIPATLPIPPLDLCIIMGNLVTNAIEACELLPVEDRHMAVRVHVKQQHLVIQVINQKQETVLITDAMIREGYSHKRSVGEVEKTGRSGGVKAAGEAEEKGIDRMNTGEHGLGLLSVRQIIQRYEGILKIEDEGRRFNVNVAIPLVISDH
ncbi:sensor histidine kinase [Anoxynatronum buryatiense]|uniref:Sensor_kinase_SpoOB-type, alpha-helical domain n=1 Tax=Anoxynatronum buryatiense TaxID=489973 RepID=A0AA45WV98_9CLOT|nr:GHKL domain-containing protein [Anoxynatronum buryatiense]SMP50873.1 Sensor_kinase_SpoOB-type, alpha-helical domain [Anoxynatronum buryatiense]